MKNLFWIVCTAILLASCQEEVTQEKKQYPQERVSMCFALQVKSLAQPEYERTVGTRAGVNAGLEVSFGLQTDTRAAQTLPIESVMKDLIVMQFAGTGDDAALIGTPQYFSQYDAEPATMSFIASNGDHHTLYFLANVGKDLGPDVTGKTLGDFKRMVHDIPAEIKLVEGQGLLMTGSWVGAISNDADVKEVLLDRAMAKISFYLTNKLSTGYIQSVSVENVPASVNYTGLTDNTSAAQLYYSTTTYDGEKEYTWYVPENLNITKEKSTCIMITVGLVDSEMVYPCRVYFNSSEDTPDYTLKRNHSYDLSVTLTGTSSTEAELLVDCHYVRGDVSTATGATVTSDANWIDVSNSSTWVSGLSQTVVSTGATVYLHVDDNLTDADRTANITVTEGLVTRTIPVRQKAVQKIGFFGAPDADGIYTKLLGVEMIEENSYLSWCTTTSIFTSTFSEYDRYQTYTGKAITTKYGTDINFEAFNYCYKKNKDKTNIEWYLPSQAQLLALLVVQNVCLLRESSAGYYGATMASQGFAVNYAFGTYKTLFRGVEDRRFVRCVRDL